MAETLVFPVQLKTLKGFAADLPRCHSGRVSTVEDPEEGIDLAVAAFQADGAWLVDDLAANHLGDIDGVASALRRFPSDAGALAMIAVDEDFFVLVRVRGTETHVLLSDVTAADEWELAASAVEHLGLPMPEDDDEPEPAGELDLLADLGVSAAELGELLDDDELYPDEILSDVARMLGFGERFDEVAGLASA
jgi:putative tRNA adenosine deaminase-associated protein